MACLQNISIEHRVVLCKDFQYGTSNSRPRLQHVIEKVSAFVVPPTLSHTKILHVINHNLLPDSVLKNPFYHFHSMFQEFDPSVITDTVITNAEICKVAKIKH